MALRGAEPVLPYSDFVPSGEAEDGRATPLPQAMTGLLTV